MKYKQFSSIFIIGGASFGKEQGCLKSVEEIRVEETDASPPQITCKIVGELLEPRRSSSVLVKNRTEAWIMGGCSAEGSHLSTIELLSKKDDGISCTAIDSTITNHSCAVFCTLNETTGVVVGGYDGFECLKDVSVVDLENCKIKSKFSLPSRFKNSCCVNDSRDVLIFGGWDEKETSKAIFRLTFNEANAPSITFEGILPSPVEGHCCTKSQDSVFMTGGFDGITVAKSIYRYDLQNKKCEILPVTLNTARENHVSVVFKEKFLLVIGGWDGKKALSSIEVFRILNEHPFLEAINSDFHLVVPRNRPAIVTV